MAGRSARSRSQVTGGHIPTKSNRNLKGISEIRTFFCTNQQPIYFVGPKAFNLLGIDRWVRNFQYVVYYDSRDGQHPRVFAPANRPYVEFGSSEEINNYLLRDAETQNYLRRRAKPSLHQRHPVAARVRAAPGAAEDHADRVRQIGHGQSALM